MSNVTPATRDLPAPPSTNEEDRIHLAKNKEVAWCGVKIGKWVPMSEWSNHPCKCCLREAMDGK
mgnify:CR=1 FL=1